MERLRIADLGMPNRDPVRTTRHRITILRYSPNLVEGKFCELLLFRVLGSSQGDSRSSSHSALALILRLQHRRRLGRRRPAPGLPVEDDQPDRHGHPHAHNDPAELVLDASFDVVRYDEQEYATCGVVEEPRVPERNRHRHHEAGHEHGRLQAALFQEEGRQVPDGNERRQDHGGEKRRVASSLQPREGNPVPARMLAQRTIRWVDQAHGEDYEEGGHGAEGQRRDARPGSDVEPYDGQVDRERHSYGHSVPVPPHAPADQPGAEFAQPREALGYGDHDEGCEERPGRQEPHGLDRQEPPRDHEGYDPERDEWVASDRRHRAPPLSRPRTAG